METLFNFKSFMSFVFFCQFFISCGEPKEEPFKDPNKISEELSFSPEESDTNEEEIIDEISDSNSSITCLNTEYRDTGGCFPLTVCNEETQYESQAPTLSSNRVCSDLSVCSENQYESQAPTLSTNRVCSDYTDCLDTEVETTAATSTSDRICTIICGPTTNDKDCDDIIAENDCDDSDPNLPLLDQDCDGVVTNIDCNDEDASDTSQLSEGSDPNDTNQDGQKNGCEYLLLGETDTSFGDQGYQYIPDSNNSYVLAGRFEVIFEIDSQGRLILGYDRRTEEDNGISLGRIDATGSWDLNFGTSGHKPFSFGYEDTEETKVSYSDLVLDSNDNLHLLGIHKTEVDDGYIDKIILAKLNSSDGALNESFASSGQFTLSVEEGDPEYSKLVIDPNSRIIMGSGAYSEDLLLFKGINKSGELDTNYGTEGDGNARFSLTGSQLLDSKLDSQSRIIAQSYSGSSISFVRTNEAGTLLDTDFGNGNGVFSISMENFSESYWTTYSLTDSGFILDYDEKILTAILHFVEEEEEPDTVPAKILIMRYAEDGSLDTNFGVNGYLEEDFRTELGKDGYFLYGISDYDITLDELGNIYVLLAISHREEEADGDMYSLILVRYTPQGVLDGSFSSDGIKIIIDSSQPDEDITGKMNFDTSGRLNIVHNDRGDGESYDKVGVLRLK